MNHELRDELIRMRDEDQRLRAELAADGSLFDGYHPRMEQVHLRNARRLEEVIEQHGIPDHRLVGEEGAAAAFLIVQHAISRPDLQRRALEWMRTQDDVDPVALAMLDDRIRVFEGRPQVYGTQFDWDENGVLGPVVPIEDPDRVNDRRHAIGMNTLEERTAEMRTSTAGQVRPTDWAKRRREMVGWARRVGWRT